MVSEGVFEIHSMFIVEVPLILKEMNKVWDVEMLNSWVTLHSIK